MSVKGAIEIPSKNQTQLSAGIKFMDDSSSSSSSEESIGEALNEAGIKSNGYLSSPAVIGYQRVSYRNEPVYGSIGPTSMPDSDSEIVHYKPSAIIRSNGLNNDSKNKRNSLELVNEFNPVEMMNQTLTSDNQSKEDKKQTQTNPVKSNDDVGRKHQSLEEFQALLFNGNNYLPIPGTVYHQPPKAADRSAAYRLAKRLYNLDGFKTTDVSKHLSKRNDFSQLVGEEFSSFFDFAGKPLDVSLRQFLLRFTLLGETQERERILHHFSKRYLQCNPNSYESEDSCHTLVCALMLLNTDLHGQHILRRMSVQDFQNNLANMNGGGDFESEELKNLYESIKLEPIRWPQPDGNVMGLVSLYCNQPMQACSNNTSMNMSNVLMMPQQNANSANIDYSGLNSVNQTVNLNGNPSNSNIQNQSSQQNLTSIQQNSSQNIQLNSSQKNMNLLPNGIWNNIPNNLTQPLTSNNEKTRKLFSEAGQSACLDIPGEINAKEYMRGFLARKWIKDSNGKKPILGKRSWKLYFGRLKDLVLYLYKDGSTATQAARAEEAYFNQLHAYLQSLYIYQNQKHTNTNEKVISPGEHEDEHTTTEEHLVDNQMEESFHANGNNDSPTNCDKNNNDTFQDDMDNKKVNGSSNFINQKSIPDDDNGGLVFENGHSNDKKSNILLPKSAELLKKETPISNGVRESCPEDEPKPPAPPNIQPPEAVIRIAHAIATKVDDYKKKVNVFKLTTKEGTEYLFQVNDGKELDLWVDKLNFVAALLSAAPMASSISSNGEFHKPLLPSSYTKLNMREQLEDYQKRILELEKEYSDYQATSQFPTEEIYDGTHSEVSTNFEDSNSEVRLSRSKSDVNDNGKLKEERVKSGKLPLRSQSIKSSLPSNQAGSNTSIASNLSIASSSISKRSLRRKGSINWPSSQNNQKSAARSAHNERVSYYKFEIHRYRTYARLLESELVRLHHFHMQQQQQAAMLLMRQSYYNLNAGFTPSPQRYLTPNSNNNSNHTTGNNGSNNISSNGFNKTNLCQQKPSVSPVAVNPFNSSLNNEQQTDQQSDKLRTPSALSSPATNLSSNNKLLLRKNARQSWRQYNAAFNQMRGQNHTRQITQNHLPVVPSTGNQQTTHQEESNLSPDEDSSPEPDSHPKIDCSNGLNSSSLYEIV